MVAWRATDVPELESALQKYAQYANMSEQQQKWSVFLPCDLQDAGSMREVLSKIGFSSSEAGQLVADESAVKYAVRGSWQGLSDLPAWLDITGVNVEAEPGARD